MKLFSTKKTDSGKLTLGEWIFGKGDRDLIDLYILGQVMGDTDLLSVLFGEIYQRDNWLEINTTAQNELFEGQLIDRNQFMLLRIIDEFNKRTEELHENTIAYLDSIGNLEASIRMIIAKNYDPKTMGEPFSNEEIQEIVDQVRVAADI